MNPFYVLCIQSTMSLVCWILIGWWHVAPRLSSRSRDAALVPLLWIHVFRFAPLALYATGQVDPQIPTDVKAGIAYADLGSPIFALSALIAVKLHVPGRMAAVWLFSVVGVADLVYATYKAVGASTYKYYLGWNWYILNFYVPMLVVAHVMILQQSLRRQP